MKDPKFTKLYEMAKKELLENILPFWANYDVDEENGGSIALLLAGDQLPQVLQPSFCGGIGEHGNAVTL